MHWLLISGHMLKPSACWNYRRAVLWWVEKAEKPQDAFHAFYDYADDRHIVQTYRDQNSDGTDDYDTDDD